MWLGSNSESEEDEVFSDSELRRIGTGIFFWAYILLWPSLFTENSGKGFFVSNSIKEDLDIIPFDFSLESL